MIRVTLALFFSWVLLLPAQTQDPSATGAASGLAARISSLLPRRSTSSFEFQNLTALPAAEWSNFRSRLLDELRKLGVGIVTTQPDSRVRVTASEDATGWLLVAEVSTGENRQIAMLPWGLPALAESTPRITLTKKLLLTQAEPILDILVEDSGSEMLVLSTDHIASYRSAGDKWMLSATRSLALPRPMPRDPRGRLEPTTDGFRAFLPVATCAGTHDPEPKLTCAGGTASWSGSAVHWVPDRNVLQSDAPAVSFEGWGSNTAVIADPCETGTAVVADSANNEHDSVRVYQLANGQATPLSDAMSLPGPVTALWPAELSREATVVVHNLQTGEYEASRLLLACAQ